MTRYHAKHDNAHGMKRIGSYFYLLWMNFAYYVLQIRRYGLMEGMEYYEEKKLPVRMSESALYSSKNPGQTVEQYLSRMSGFDIVSFDIFDTLIFRCLEKPTDLFWMMGEELEITDFKRLRMLSEHEARVRCQEKTGTMEITLDEIYEVLSEKILLEPDASRKELELEERFCYANPFMLEVWRKLVSAGKPIVVVSDMYLPEAFLQRLLEKNGFTGYEKLYVSNTYRKSKAEGSLFRLVKEELEGKSGKTLKIIHVGDNVISDGDRAVKNGFESLPYGKTDQKTNVYRSHDMSLMIGSAYRALIDNHLYNGLYSFSMEYEYGFVYGGLFVLGYCHFIHEYCRQKGIDKILFLARDGDMIQRVYEKLYPEEKTAYGLWSRKTATKLMAERDRSDFFRRFIYHKVNQSISVEKALESMELGALTEELRSAGRGQLRPEDLLTNKNSRELEAFLRENWEKVQAVYAEQQSAAKKYYGQILSGAEKCAAVDIGWAGSGALSLRYLTKNVWNIPCEVVGILAGTNTLYNAEPDATEPFLQSGKLVSYLYGQGFNRDLLKKHDPNKDYNVFWELLLSSLNPKFNGFYEGSRGAEGDVYDENLDITFGFGSCDPNPEGIRDIQTGILDFADFYIKSFQGFPYMFAISGRDAYAPVLTAAGKNEKYLKTIEQKFGLEINVG